MTPRLTMNIMLMLSVCYGAVVAVLAFLDSDAIGTFAVIGAVVLGVLWTVRSFITRGTRGTRAG